MSKRRRPGEIVQRFRGSGFRANNINNIGSYVDFVQVPTMPAYETECEPCANGCGDAFCREWANLAVPDDLTEGDIMYHISECQMTDRVLNVAIMDGKDGPVCWCGQPSTYESGWCGCGVEGNSNG